MSDSPPRRCLPIPPPCLPLLHVRYTLPSSYGGSVTRLPFTCAAAGIPDSPHLNLPVVLSPTTHVFPCPLSSCSFSFAFWGRHRRAVSSLRPPALSASPLASRLAKTQGRIEFLVVRTDRLAFRCSPPRLTTTQLRSAFNQSSIWLRVFSPPLQVRSRAH